MRSVLEATGLTRRSEGISRKARQAVVSPIKEMALLAEKFPTAVSLGWGVPSFNTPEHIRQAASRCLLEDNSIGKYPPTRGMVDLRKAIALKLEQTWQAAYDSDHEILVTVGGQQALFSALMTIVDPGDEVILASPSYSSHIEQALLTEAIPVFVELNEEAGWSLKAEQIERALSSRTKAIILNYPANPTGAVFDSGEMRRIAELAVSRRVFVVFDATYAYLCYDGHLPFNLFSVPSLWPWLIGCFSFSKEYAMTGWRVGYLCAEAGVLEEVAKVHDAAIVVAPRVSQVAALAALQGPQDCVREFCRAFERRRNLTCTRLDRLNKVFSYVMPAGSYYVFPKILDSSVNSLKLSLSLLHEAGVVTVPGEAFGPYGKGHLRLCFAKEDEEISEAFDRMDLFFEKRP